LTTIGVFDSGVGGLSVLRALLVEMPDAHYVYLADNAFAPYGERSQQEIGDRAQRITQKLLHDHGTDALVVACNTATAVAIEGLREAWPQLPIIGVEPALKPAAAISRTGHIGVLATRRTVESPRYAALRTRVLGEARRPLHISTQACDGLADAIERGDDAIVRTLCERYLGMLSQQHAGSDSRMDTLVLGCTHYPFAADVLQELCGPDVTLVETGAPVARRTRSVLQLPAVARGQVDKGTVRLFSTGDPQALDRAAHRWLDLSIASQRLTV
jgi:glutamate racemase